MRESFEKLRVFYINSILGSSVSAFIMPFYVIYMLNLGITQFQLGTLMSVYFLIPVFLTPLVGALGDALSRKNLVLLGLSFAITSYLIMYGADSYPQFMLAMVFMSASLALVKYPLSAWKMDEIKCFYREKGWVKHLSRIELAGEVSFVVSSIVAFAIFTTLIEHGVIQVIRFFWLMAVALTAANLLNFIVSKEVKSDREREGESAECERIRDVFSELLTNYRKFIYLVRGSCFLKIFIVSFALYSVGYAVVYTAFFPYLKSILGIPEQYYNLVFLFSSLIAMALYYMNDRMVKLLKGEKNAIIITEVVSMLLLFTLGLVTGMPLLSLLLLNLVIGIEAGTSPIFSALMNKPIPSSIRSTTMSLISLPAGLGGSIGGIIYGVVSQLYGLSVSLYVALMIILLATALLAFARE